MHVNKSTSEYCAYHAGAALKALATDRMVGGARDASHHRPFGFRVDLQ